MDKKELEMKIKNVQSTDEILELFKAAGEEISVEDAAELYEKVKARNEFKELSLDELEEVAGGRADTRDWIAEGCSATVEPDSNCWKTDGGCSMWNIDYINGPNTDQRCPKCGGYMRYNGLFFSTSRRIFFNEYVCHKCGIIEMPG